MENTEDICSYDNTIVTMRNEGTVFLFTMYKYIVINIEIYL